VRRTDNVILYVISTVLEFTFIEFPPVVIIDVIVTSRPWFLHVCKYALYTCTTAPLSVYRINTINLITGLRVTFESEN